PRAESSESASAKEISTGYFDLHFGRLLESVEWSSRWSYERRQVAQSALDSNQSAFLCKSAQNSLYKLRRIDWRRTYFVCTADVVRRFARTFGIIEMDGHQGRVSLDLVAYPGVNRESNSEIYFRIKLGATCSQ